MSTSSIGSPSGAPINITGLGSGLDTNSIIAALLSVERLPVTHKTNQQTTLNAQQAQLRTIQGNLQSLAFSAADLASPSLFKSAQSVSSSEPTRVTATTSSGAAVGGYEVEVSKLANSAQRTFTFTSPTSAEALTIDGHSTEVAAGATIQAFVDSINSDSSATVYAAALENGSVVLSSRETGNNGAGFIQVSAPGGTLVEQAGLAKEGKNAEYSIDGVAGSSKSNIIKNAIPGVTLSLASLTTTGPVTINVAAPGPSTSAITEQVQAFVKLYNSTIGSIQTQLSTKPPANPQNPIELGMGTLFGDSDLSSLLSSMRRSVYAPGAGLPAEMSSLTNIGISTGAPTTGGSFSQSAVSGQLTVNTAQLESALQSNPTGVKLMLQSWSSTFQNILNTDSQPGGTIDARISSDGTQVSDLSHQISTMNEMITLRQQALQQQYTALESVMAQNQTQAAWLASQTFPSYNNN